MKLKFELLSPINGESVHVIDEQIVNYLNEANKNLDLANIDLYANSETNIGPVPVSFKFNTNKKIKSARIHISKSKDFEKEQIIITKDKTAEIYNLEVDTIYYWRVSNRDNFSDVQQFVTYNEPRMLKIGSVKNVRDLGGTLACGTKIKQGLLFRGYELTEKSYYHTNREGYNLFHKKILFKKDAEIFNNFLHVKTELDFRGNEESGLKVTSGLGKEINYFRLPITAYKGALGLNKDNSIIPGMTNLYRQVFEILAEEKNYPVYFHCWGGADRTGTVAFLIRGLCGANLTELVTDYEITSFSGAVRNHKYNDLNMNYSNFCELVSEIQKRYRRSENEPWSEVITRYMKTCLGLSEGTIEKLKRIIVEKA